MEITEVFGVGQLLAVGSANLIVTVLALRNARRSVNLAEDRVEALRAEQTRLVALLREERRMLRKVMGEERVRHLSLSEARRGDRAGWEPAAASPAERERVADELRQALADRERERHARLATEDRIERLEREIHALRDAARRDDAQPVLAGTREIADESKGAVPPRRAVPAAGVRDLFGTASRTSKGLGGGDQGQGRAQWHLHPDDRAVERPAPPRAKTGARAGAPVEMFRKHYDKYLENYEGYVELAENLRRTRDAGETPHSPFGERELQDRLRRLKDGIRRTTARLDMLEQYNPELATDDRISRRANIARRHSRVL